MARKTADTATFPSLTVEGNLLSSAILGAVYALNAGEQTPEGYRIRQGLSLRDESSLSFRVAHAHFDKFARLGSPGRAATADFMRGLLTEAFAFSDLADGPLPLSLIAGDGRIPIAIVPPGDELDRSSEVLSEERMRSAAVALQDHLNDRTEALWGLASNGTKLRLMRDNASFARPAYIEADLAQIFETEDIASFATLWLLIHRTRFGQAGTRAADCALERWRDAGGREGEAARDRLAGQVEDALRVLGSGFLAENESLRARLETGDLKLTDVFNELLKLVYRLIFLMVAEDRAVLHPDSAGRDAREIYAREYSVASLRQLALRRSAWDRHHDRFDGMKVVFTGLAHGEKRLALPALGGLFAEGQMPILCRARLPNRAFFEALFKLGWLRQDGALVPVNWRVMETEELGSVYESLLELQPLIAPDGRAMIFASDVAETKGNQRKTTGAYYTPDSLVQTLLDSALDPALDKTEAEAGDPAEALLDLAVIDPACGSGHFLLAAARRIATRVARHRAEGAPSAADFRRALRDTARRCIHGVDRNPMAVELTKVALWIETVDPGLPLGFFDAQIRCGDALLGVFDLKAIEDGIPEAAYMPLTGDDKDTAKYYAEANQDTMKGQSGFDFGTDRTVMPAMKPLASEFSGFRDLPEDTVEQIGDKAGRLAELRKGRGFVRAKAAADLYVAAFLLPKTGGAPAGPWACTVPTTKDLWAALTQDKIRPAMVDALQAARSAGAFHWPLEFPDITGRGGFDIVLGNPPWERIKLQEKKFFAPRDVEIATAANKAARDRLIGGLAAAEPGTAKRRLFDEFTEQKRLSEAVSAFVCVPGDDGGRFPLTGTGDVNTYALHAELFSRLVSKQGRAGVIVPTGIATDATTAPFFAYLVDEKRLVSLVDFENREGLFPAAHSRMKFCLLTLGQNEPEVRFAFFLTEPAQLAEHERNFTLSPEQIAAINPNTRTAPVFRSRADAELTAKVYRNAPVLIDAHKGPQGNPWRVSLRRMLDKTSASRRGYLKTHSEVPADAIGSDWLPVHEGKHGWLFDHRFATYFASEVRVLTPSEKADPEFESAFELVASRSEYIRIIDRWGLSAKDSSLLGFRRVSRSTDERTLVAAIFPNMPMTYGWILVAGADSSSQAKLLANHNSLVVDYTLRNSLSQPSIPQETAAQLPVLPRTFYTENRLAFIIPRVLELTYTSHALTPFARDLGHNGPPFAWDEDRRAQLRAELDAFYARAYGLTRDELRYILDPADVKGPDYPSETFRVLKEKEERKHREYRTRRLVLEAWDRMEADSTFRSLKLRHDVRNPPTLCHDRTCQGRS